MSAAARVLGVWSAFDAREVVTYLSGCNVPVEGFHFTRHHSPPAFRPPGHSRRALSCYSTTHAGRDGGGRSHRARRHPGDPARSSGRRVAASLGSGVPPSRRRRDRPVRVSSSDEKPMMSSRRAPSRRLPRDDDDDDDDDAPSTSGRIVLIAAILRGFDLDPALGVDHRALPLDRVWLPLGADAGVARGRRRRIRAANAAPGARARRRGARQARRDVAHATLGVGRRGVGIVGGRSVGAMAVLPEPGVDGGGCAQRRRVRARRLRRGASRGRGD